MKAALIGALAAAMLLGQAPQNRPAESPQSTIRSTSQEVLLDVVVRDKKGHQIKNLTAADFELMDDGQRQTIRSFRQVTIPEGAVANELPPPTPVGAASTPEKPKPVALDPFRQVRIITLAFDRLGPDARNNARKAVEDLLKTEGGPNLFFAVFAIDQRLKIVQEYTTDKALILKAVHKITDSSSTLYKAEEDTIVAPATTGGGDANDALAAMQNDMAQFNEDVERPLRSRSTLLALESLIPPQYRLPGRKTLLLFCEGIVIEPEYVDEFKGLISTANRANVSVYGIDARGLTGMSQTAAGGSLLGGAIGASASQQNNHPGPVRRNQVQVFDHAMSGIRANSQNSLDELSVKTGGFMIANTNDFRPGIHKVTEDLNTHYEIAYAPDIRTFDGHFRQIAVTVKRADAQVATRDGYYALPFVPGETVLPSEVPLLKALSTSALPRDIPFRSAGLHFRSSHGDAVDVVMDVPLSGVQFTSDAEKKTYDIHFSVLALIKDQQGSVVKKFSEDVPRQGPLDKMEGFKLGHFVYTKHAPLPPGRYTLETAVIDRKTEKLSAKRTSILIPAVGEDLSISSVVRVRGVAPNVVPDTILKTDDPFQMGNGKITPGLDDDARATAGSVLSLFFTVYVAAGTQSSPNLHVDFYRDGQLVLRGEPALPSPDSNGRIPFIATTPLDAFKPGQYEVRITASQQNKAATERTSLVVE